MTVSFSPMLLALYHQYSSLIYIYIYCYNVYIHSMAFGDCQFLAYALGTLSPIFITNIYIYILVITYIFTQWRLVTVSLSPMLLALYHQYSSLIYIYIYIYSYNVYIHSMAFGDCQFLAYALGTLSPIFITNIYIYIYSYNVYIHSMAFGDCQFLAYALGTLSPIFITNIYIYIYIVITYIFTQWRLVTVSFSPMLLALYHQYSSLIYIYIYCYNVYIHSMAFGDCQFLAYALGTLSPIFITNIYIYILL